MFAILAISSAADLAAQSQSIASIKALHEYAGKNGISPKDYIFKLFEKSDIVVLGERDHRDSVQYNFILDLLADSRFAERVGYVYTEVGGINLTEDVNRLLNATYATEDDFMDSPPTIGKASVSIRYGKNTTVSSFSKVCIKSIRNPPVKYIWA